MKRDDLKFILAVAATLVFGAFAILSSRRHELQPGAAPTVDVGRIEQMAKKGALSLHEASHWEPALDEGG